MSLHRIGQARGELHSAIAAILDQGRVAAYPKPEDVGVAVWIDVPSVASSGNTIEVDFPVHATYDGTDEAQVAGLDDVVSRVWDACERLKTTTPLRASPGPDITIGGRNRRRQIITVRRAIAARTLCLPDAPGESPVPPDKIQE